MKKHDRISERCESPIEKLFICAWTDLMEVMEDFCCEGGDFQFYERIPEIRPFDLTFHQQTDLYFPQQQVGPYRVDFALIRFSIDYVGDSLDESLRRLPTLIVECDGHDFHEKTKEQAQRDKERDRYLVSQGYRVLRFTGSELFRDSAKCAKEVDAVFGSILHPRFINKDFRKD